MHYSELMKLGDEAREETLRSLSDDELATLCDQKPYLLKSLTLQKDCRYFDTIEELYDYLLTDYVPATKPWLAGESASHELAHAECARAVGVVGVKYYALDTMDATHTSIFAQPYGPVELPNLAWAAISMYPYAAHLSPTDMRNIRSYGYASRDQVAQRIRQWNEGESGLYIPEPQTQPVIYP
jgi:hypothetical protein